MWSREQAMKQHVLRMSQSGKYTAPAWTIITLTSKCQFSPFANLSRRAYHTWSTCSESWSVMRPISSNLDLMFSWLLFTPISCSSLVVCSIESGRSWSFEKTESRSPSSPSVHVADEGLWASADSRFWDEALDMKADTQTCETHETLKSSACLASDVVGCRVKR